MTEITIDVKMAKKLRQYANRSVLKGLLEWNCYWEIIDELDRLIKETEGEEE